MKIASFFQRFRLRKHPNGERIRSEEALREVGNGYFRKIGQYFKTAQILLFVLLFLFVTVFALTNSSSVTYANLYYFFKDFRTAVDNTDASVDAISYETDESTAFAVYKGGLAVAGRERLRLLTAAGGLNSSSSLGFAAPAMSASTDLLLVYARGERECHVYNSFTRIHSDTVEGDIRSAYLSESGAYSVTAADDEYESAVYVYSRNFRKLNKFKLNSYAIAAPLSDDGKTIAILSYVCVDGVYETRVRVAEVGTDRILQDYAVSGQFPLGISFTDRDTALLLTDGGLYRVSAKDGGSVCTEWNTDSICAFSLDESGAAIVLADFSEKSGNTLITTDTKGEILQSVGIDRVVRAVKRYGAYLFYRTDTALVRVNAENGERSNLPCKDADGYLLAVSEDCALICLSGEAKYYRF